MKVSIFIDESNIHAWFRPFHEKNVIFSMFCVHGKRRDTFFFAQSLTTMTVHEHSSPIPLAMQTYIHLSRDLQYTASCPFHFHQASTIWRSVDMDHSYDEYWSRRCSLPMDYSRTTRWVCHVRASISSPSFLWTRPLLYLHSVCGRPPDASLDGAKCTIKYTPTTMKPWVIALKVEDFETSTSRNALSSISLQFIVEVYRDTYTCKTRMWSWKIRHMPWLNQQVLNLFAVPSYVGVQPAGSCIRLAVGEIIKDVVQFITECANQIVIEVETQKPAGKEIENVPSRSTFDLHFGNWHLGMTVSAVKKHARNSSLFIVSITWTPKPRDVGLHLACYIPVSWSDTNELFSYWFLYYSWIIESDKVAKLASNTLSVMTAQIKRRIILSLVSNPIRKNEESEAKEIFTFRKHDAGRSSGCQGQYLVHSIHTLCHSTIDQRCLHPVLFEINRTSGACNQRSDQSNRRAVLATHTVISHADDLDRSESSGSFVSRILVMLMVL